MPPHLGELQAENCQVCENLCAEAALVGVGNMLLFAALSKVQPVLPFPPSATETVPDSRCGTEQVPLPSASAMCHQSLPCGQLMAQESPVCAREL